MSIANPKNMLTPPASRQPMCSMKRKPIPTVKKTGETAQLNQYLPLEIPSYVISGVEEFIAFTRSNK